MDVKIALILLVCSAVFAAVPQQRFADPVVLEGTDAPDLIGQDPVKQVGFRY